MQLRELNVLNDEKFNQHLCQTNHDVASDPAVTSHAHDIQIVISINTKKCQ